MGRGEDISKPFSRDKEAAITPEGMVSHLLLPLGVCTEVGVVEKHTTRGFNVARSGLAAADASSTIVGPEPRSGVLELRAVRSAAQQQVR